MKPDTFSTVNGIDSIMEDILTEIRGYSTVSQDDLSDVESLDSYEDSVDPTFALGKEFREEQEESVWRSHGKKRSVPCCTNDTVATIVCKKKRAVKKGQDTFVYKELVFV